MKFYQYLDDSRIVKKFISESNPVMYDRLRIIDELSEAFDTDVDVREVNSPFFDFETIFTIADIEYSFKSKKYPDNKWSVGFEADDGKGLYDLLKSGKFVGNVFSGVFKSINMLLKKHDIDAFVFNTDKQALIRIYDRMKSYTEARTGFTFVDSNTHNGVKSYTYKRKGK